MPDTPPPAPPAAPAPVLILGDGPDALLTAATLAGVGSPVQLLLTRSLDEVVAAAALAWPLSRWAGLGAETEGPAPGARSLAVGGVVLPLPVPRRSLAALGPALDAAAVLRQLVRARARNALAELGGGGQEERSYEDWVVRRFGRPLHAALFAPYAQARWGCPPGALAASLARLHHGLPDRRPSVAPTPDPGLRWKETLLQAGVELRDSLAVAALEVAEGRVAAVVFADGDRIPTPAGLWCAVAPDRIRRWLGADCPTEAAAQTAHLRVSTAVRLRVDDAPDLPCGATGALHVSAPGSPLWRVESGTTVPGRVLSGTVAPGGEDAAPAEMLAGHTAAVGCGAGTVAETVVLPDWEPVWSPTSHARLRRVLLAWDGLGITAVGRAGLFADVDPPVIEAHALSILEAPGGSSWDRLRRFAGPPVRARDLDVPLRSFVER